MAILNFVAIFADETVINQIPVMRGGLRGPVQHCLQISFLLFLSTLVVVTASPLLN